MKNTWCWARGVIILHSPRQQRGAGPIRQQNSPDLAIASFFVASLKHPVKSPEKHQTDCKAAVLCEAHIVSYKIRGTCTEYGERRCQYGVKFRCLCEPPRPSQSGNSNTHCSMSLGWVQDNPLPTLWCSLYSGLSNPKLCKKVFVGKADTFGPEIEDHELRLQDDVSEDAKTNPGTGLNPPITCRGVDISVVYIAAGHQACELLDLYG